MLYSIVSPNSEEKLERLRKPVDRYLRKIRDDDKKKDDDYNVIIDQENNEVNLHKNVDIESELRSKSIEIVEFFNSKILDSVDKSGRRSKNMVISMAALLLKQEKYSATFAKVEIVTKYPFIILKNDDFKPN